MALCIVLMSAHDLRCSRNLTASLSCSYCADLVQKRLHNDVMPLIEAMRSGFNLVSPVSSCDAAPRCSSEFKHHPTTSSAIKACIVWQSTLLSHVAQVQPDDLTLRQMDAAQLQHKLFPLHPVTLEEFKSNAQVQASSNSEDNQKLLWRVMAEDLRDDQVRR